MAELKIPTAARVALSLIINNEGHEEGADAAAQVIAVPVVAAELRRFAAELIRPYDETGAWWPAIKDAHDRMLRRAAELDGGEQS